MSKLSCYQLKINCSKMFYVSLIVTTKQKSIADWQKIMRKESEHSTTEDHQFLKEGSKRGRKE